MCHCVFLSLSTYIWGLWPTSTVFFLLIYIFTPGFHIISTRVFRSLPFQASACGVDCMVL